MSSEETVTIRVNKKLVEEIRKNKTDWKSANATLIVDMVLRKYIKVLTEGGD